MQRKKVELVPVFSRPSTPTGQNEYGPLCIEASVDSKALLNGAAAVPRRIEETRLFHEYRSKVTTYGTSNTAAPPDRRQYDHVNHNWPGVTNPGEEVRGYKRLASPSPSDLPLDPYGGALATTMPPPPRPHQSC